MPSYSGVWTLTAQYQAIGLNNWPAAPSFWIGRLVASPTSGEIHAVTTSSTGDIYIAGANSSTTTGGAVYKLSYGASLTWQRALYATSTGMYEAVTSSANGNIISVGYGNDGTNPAYISLAAYNSAGTLQWQKKLSPAATNSSAYGVVTDSSNNIYIAGQFDGSNNAGVAKYDSTGALQWQRYIAGATGNIGYDVALDSSSNVYLAGKYDNFGIIAKYDSSGTFQWARKTNGNPSVEYYGIVSNSSGTTYATGYAAVGGVNRQLLISYSNSGSVNFKTYLAGDSTNAVTGRSIAMDSSGNLYIAATIPEAGQAGRTAAIISKFDSNGTKQWSNRFRINSNSLSYPSIYIDSMDVILFSCTVSSSGIVARLPSDGSKTGTYTVSGLTIVYASVAYTSGAQTITELAYGGTNGTSSLTESTATDTSGTPTRTFSATIV